MQQRRTIVVTGANRGIGLAVAHQLAGRGCRVVLVARDQQAGREALRAVGRVGEASLVVGDLSTPAATRLTAARLLDACPCFDVLVHNAGLWPVGLERDGGVERAFAVNHLAPFLLNHLLATALPRGGRIVQVSAGLYVKGRVDLERTPCGDDFHPIRTYATTKLCNLLLLERFARRFEAAGVTINALHPGVIRTGLGDRRGAFGLLLRAVKQLWKSPDEGARHVVRLAIDPTLSSVTGKYFHLSDETALADVARDEALAAQVWQQASDLCGLAAEVHDVHHHAGAPS